MASNKKQYWFASYLYYSGSFDIFLKQAISPFIKKVLKNKWADGYFFIRYFERGPHIRLRFTGSEKTLLESVKPKLEKHFNAYYVKNPSVRNEPEYVKSLPENQSWFPNNSVQFITYEPEIDRYGGDHAIVTGEKQFEYSSNAVLTLLKESKDWNYNRAMGAAVQMHLAFAHALNMDLKETQLFFDRVYESWFGYLYNFYKIKDKNDLKKRRDELNASFKISFDQQKGSLIDYYTKFWEALQESVEFEQEWLNVWIADMKKIGKELKSLQKKDKIVFPQLFRKVDTSIVTMKKQQMWTIYYSYIHMTNNRLGILNRDEAYLGYLVKNTLKEFNAL